MSTEINALFTAIEEQRRTETREYHGLKHFFKKTTKYNVIVEGNIGAGKSTLLKYFEGFESTELQTFEEPLKKWTDFHGVNLLELMYKDTPTWIFPFQIYSMLTLIQNHTKKLNVNVKVMERSIYSAIYCFIELNHQLNNIDSVKYEILKQWFNHLLESANIKIDLIIYLRTAPAVAYARIKHRNRQEEENIDLNYVTALNKAYDEWLIKRTFPIPARVIILDGNQSPDDILLELDEKMFCVGMENFFAFEGNESNEIPIFRKKRKFLSNLYPVEIEWNNRVFKSAEHCYQFEKCLNESDAEKIYECETSKSARILGKLVKRQPYWHIDRVKVMERILKKKFRNKKLKKMLLMTDTKTLLNQNFYHDLFWGVCGCTKHQRKGKNMLGKILMKIRAAKRAKLPANPIPPSMNLN